MNYEFHVGDYVETVEGKKGYLSRYQVLSDGHIVFYVQYKDEKIYPCDLKEDGIKYRFVRIGAYDFTKEEKKKIEQLNYIVTETGTIYQLSALKNKINELFDAVNLLMDKEEDR